MRPLDVLEALNLPEELVKQCQAILATNAGALRTEGRPPNVGAAVFGASGKGKLLEFHTSIAHQHVVDALEKMVVGLQGYAENLGGFAKDLREQDEQAAADLSPSRKSGLDLTPAERRALEENAVRTGGPDFHDGADAPTGVGS